MDILIQATYFLKEALGPDYWTEPRRKVRSEAMRAANAYENKIGKMEWYDKPSHCVIAVDGTVWVVIPAHEDEDETWQEEERLELIDTAFGKTRNMSQMNLPEEERFNLNNELRFPRGSFEDAQSFQYAVLFGDEREWENAKNRLSW